MGQLDDKFTKLADAIRAKSGVSGKLSLDQMVNAVNVISDSKPGLQVTLNRHSKLDDSLLGHIGGNWGKYVSKYKIIGIDYDGTVLFTHYAHAGEEFTLPEGPVHSELRWYVDKSCLADSGYNLPSYHAYAKFSSWLCVTDAIVDNKVTVSDHDIILGAQYDIAAEGDFEADRAIRIHLQDADSFEMLFWLDDTYSEERIAIVQWGDNSYPTIIRKWDDTESTYHLSHTYSETGSYMITITYFSADDANDLDGWDGSAMIKFLGYSGDASDNSTMHRIELYGKGSIITTELAHCLSLKTLLISDGTILNQDSNGICTNTSIKACIGKIYTEASFNFANCTEMQTAIIQPVSSTLGEGMFLNCFNLQICPIASNVEHIKSDAFIGCGHLDRVELPQSVTSLGVRCFERCESLRCVDMFSTQISEIPTDCFCECSHLNQVKLPSSLQKVGAYAFSDCWNLTTLVLPESVVSIENFAFRGTSLFYFAIPPQCLITSLDQLPSIYYIHHTIIDYRWNSNIAQFTDWGNALVDYRYMFLVSASDYNKWYEYYGDSGNFVSCLDWSVISNNVDEAQVKYSDLVYLHNRTI